MNGRALHMAVGLLWIAVLGSALAVIFCRHEARSYFIELQKLMAQRDQLDIEWGQLQIEQSTVATHGRVESVARDDLHMTIPQAADLRIVQP